MQIRHLSLINYRRCQAKSPKWAPENASCKQLRPRSVNHHLSLQWSTSRETFSTIRQRAVMASLSRAITRRLAISISARDNIYTRRPVARSNFAPICVTTWLHKAIKALRTSKSSIKTCYQQVCRKLWSFSIQLESHAKWSSLIAFRTHKTWLRKSRASIKLWPHKNLTRGRK